jgi:hypothetical protein
LKSHPSLDDLRATYPHLGFGIYAIEPGGPVTIEVYAADGQVFPFTGPTLRACLNRAFPADEPDPEPAPEPTPEPPTTTVFD